MNDPTKAVVRIRRGDAWQVKAVAEEMDGVSVEVDRGWVIEESDSAIYVGEIAWIIRTPRVPGWPNWLAGGDLQFT